MKAYLDNMNLSEVHNGKGRVSAKIIFNDIISTDEYVKEFCSKCINRKGFDDVCEIRRNIKGDLQCLNFKEEKKENK